MSNLDEMKNNSFPKVTLEEWTAQAEKALKGKPVSKLNSLTYEGITRKPIYTEVDLEGSTPFNKEGSADWTVSQQLYPGTSLEEMNNQLLQELQNGLQAIHFTVKPAINSKALEITSQEELEKLLKNVPFEQVPLQVYAGSSTSEFINLLKDSSIDKTHVHGIIGADPIGELATAGSLNEPLEQLFDEMKANLEWKKQSETRVKTIWIQAAPFHNGGASAVEELAATMATAVTYLNALMERGATVQEAASEMAFSFPIGSDFFMEISKLRAARLLWANIVEAYGGDEEARKMTLHASTSVFTKSNLDPYVNMLRTTTEAFSAAIGGAESINIDSYQQGADAFSRRIARNTHYILKEESFLSKVVDPAAGSYYVEKLTHQLADEAWKLFQEIEGHGGMVGALETGFLQEKIKQVREKRMKDVESRKKVLVGTNMYANLGEQLPTREQANVAVSIENGVEPISPIKLSQPFETLRYQAKEYAEKTGAKPNITLINLGSLASHKPRTDFATGFFHVGGLSTNVSPSFSSMEELEAWLAQGPTSDYICVCGSDDTYGIMLDDALSLLQNHPVKIILAGLPDGERQADLNQRGVTDFIHMKSNCYEQLTVIHQEMGLTSNEA
ncbi:methylmalonyl-CoA mutase subunit beta [Bacillus tianshenii]|uniref:methylmalonyl-CoA mutase subunit beta n=1 Tax=Sutcliffiella tianshenii TaxID=1463404 RepID=UPI001CD7D5E3|nr:methylmalonyl-CoA mutase subunit beta [Bacillus tianshenii]MCA1320612.1 methylmalonyl-CoA mutase subunit beta [Bacillus tianshenii]